LSFLKVVPFFATIASGGVFLVCFVVSLLLSIVIISLSWVIARPFLVIGLALLGVGIGLLITYLHKKQVSAGL